MVGRFIALLFHDRGTRRGWVVSSTPRPYFTSGIDPVPIVQEAEWAPVPVWTAGNLAPPGFLPQNIHLVVSHYMNWATRPTPVDNISVQITSFEICTVKFTTCLLTTEWLLGFFNLHNFTFYILCIFTKKRLQEKRINKTASQWQLGFKKLAYFEPAIGTEIPNHIGQTYLTYVLIRKWSFVRYSLKCVCWHKECMEWKILNY